jgi:hypothetical protein
MRASILLTALPLAAAACAVSPEVTPYPPDASQDSIDASTADASGPGPDASPIGGDAGSPFDAALSWLEVGWPEPFVGSQIQLPADTLFVFELPIIEGPVLLEAWGIIPDQITDAQVRMALYRDSGGGPGELVSFSDAWPAQEEQEPAGRDPLPAGIYWLAVIASDSFAVGNDPTQPVNACPGSYSFDQAFANPFDSTGTSCTQLDAMNIYILVLDAN